MSNYSILIGIAMTLESTAALAGTCTKIDYAEARDWPVEQLEQSYCAELETSYQSFKKATEYMGRNTYAANRILDDSRICDDNIKMFQRILQNVHKRPPAKCSDMPQQDLPRSPERERQALPQPEQGDHKVPEGGYCTRASQCVVGAACRQNRCIVD
jgi:hypothetical protein